MTGNIIGFTGLIVSILLLILFIIGLRYSKIHSFKPGIYFFLLLVVYEIYSFVSPPLIQNYIDNLLAENKEPLMMGMTIGEFVALLSLIPKVLLFAAFLFLIVGIRSFWSKKHVFSK